MNIAVRYQSRSGNTRGVAEAIGKAVGVEAQDCSVPLDEAAGLLFLGGAVYGARLDEKMRAYIEQLDPQGVKKVALFGTSALVKSGAAQMRERLEERHIKVLDGDFYCRGAFTFMHRGHPDAEDLRQAAAWARVLIDSSKD
ncbi:flavodoxin family protein [Thermophilibacter immobilis]|jgi:flavodoxin|uniref:Flavodoxin n=1 Tax=Thermophilibacter immobilis TaxID=2779519 RepID=A0A7S7M9N3_9ACTN|nr:flavodoxin family protein [Thermophilibacter immobilis]QOY61302.1 flavodoxin [Thermophilibacter immobilis]